MILEIRLFGISKCSQIIRRESKKTLFGRHDTRVYCGRPVTRIAVDAHPGADQIVAICDECFAQIHRESVVIHVSTPTTA